MKFFVIIITFFLTIVGISAQNFAPIGAEWYYGEGYAFSGNIDYIKFTSEKDTLFAGKICRKITKRHKLGCNDRTYTEFVFTKNDTVFFYDPFFNEFQILYVFNAKVSDSWVIKIKNEQQDTDTIFIIVNSISTMNVNGVDLKALNVTYNKPHENMPETYSSTIVERIGDVHYMFNWFPWFSHVCDDNYTNGLRCYQDQDIGLYSTGIADSCTYMYDWTSIKNRNSNTKFQVFPNPTSDYIDISTLSEIEITAELLDLFGNTILTKKFYFNTRINLPKLSKGLYIVVIKNDEKVLYFKRILNH